MQAEADPWIQRWQALPGMQRSFMAIHLAGQLPLLVGLEGDARALLAWLEGGLSVLIEGPAGAGRTARVLALAREASDRGLWIWQLSVRILLALSSPKRGLRGLERACREGRSAGQRLAVYLPDALSQLETQSEAVLALLDLLAGLDVPVLLEGDTAQQQRLLQTRPRWRQQGQVLRVKALGLDPTVELLSTLAVLARQQGRPLPVALSASREGLRLLVDVAERSGFWGALPGGALRLARVLESSLLRHTPAQGILETDPLIQALARETRADASFLMHMPLRLPSLTGVRSSSRRERRVLGTGRPLLLSQKAALETVQEMLRPVVQRQGSRASPAFSLLCLGPAGHGQQQLVEELCTVIAEPLCHLRLGPTAEPPSAATLIQQVALHMRASPMGILWLEELDAAPPELQRVLQAWKEGGRWPSEPEPVVATGWGLLASSALGAAHLVPLAFGDERLSVVEEAETAVHQRVFSALPPGLREHWDAVVVLHPPTEQERLQVAEESVERLAFRLSQPGSPVELQVQAGVVDWLAIRGYDPLTGFQALERLLGSTLQPLLQQGGDLSRQKKPGQPLSLDVLRVKGELQVREHAPLPAEGPSAPALLSFRSPQAPHNPDLFSLVLRGENVLLLAAGRIRRLQASLRALERLRGGLREPALWLEPAGGLPLAGAGASRKDGQSALALLDDYRRVLLRIRGEQRYYEPLERLDALLKQDRGSLRSDDLERAVLRAEQALQAWEIFEAEEDVCSVWMVLQPGDSSPLSARWLLEVTAMELAWCSRLGFKAEVMACERMYDTLSRLILKATGTGAVLALEMEEGRHQRVRDAGSTQVSLELILASPAPEEIRPGLKNIPPTNGPLGLELACRGRLELKTRHQFCDLEAASPLELSHLLQDLERAWSGPVEPLPLARRYAEDAQGGVEDVRSNVKGLRLVDVLSGELRELARAWRSHMSKPSSLRPLGTI